MTGNSPVSSRPSFGGKNCGKNFKKGVDNRQAVVYDGKVEKKRAGIAQLVEQRTENPRVGGSNPPPGIPQPPPN